MLPRRAPQTNVRTRLAAFRAASGLTQKEMAWAIGIPIAVYIRLERGNHDNPRLGWLVNAAKVLNCDLDELFDERMLAWYRSDGFDRPEPPSPEWLVRPEVVARARRWRQDQEEGR